ncbi:UNVERIFIED_CONTAM: hypothetical protein PYX00_005581 [Menopon gallinae]
MKAHILAHKVDFILWALRVCTVCFTIGHFIPFWNPHVSYYKVLVINVIISALRLRQRLPQIFFTRTQLSELVMEDSFHYLSYSIIFFITAPVTLALLPILLFSLLHSASYSLTLLDKLGPNSVWPARIFISLVELQSRTILRLISVTEIILMPLTIIFSLMGRAVFFIPVMYYLFLLLRYSSRRNPYTRNMFHEMRLGLESTANKPETPPILRNILLMIVNYACQLHPTFLREFNR